jgi:hypothetical protein
MTDRGATVSLGLGTNFYVYRAGAWKEAGEVFICISNSFHAVQSVYVMVDGAWTVIFQK